MEGAGSQISDGRRIGFVVLDAVYLVVFAVVLFAGVSLVTGWFEGGDRLIHRVHDIGYGALGGVLICGGLLAMLFGRGRKPAAMQQVLLGAAAFAVGMAISGEWGDAALALVFVGAFAILAFLHPDRVEVLRSRDRSLSPALAAVTVIGAVPAFAYMVATAKLQRTGVLTDSHVEEGHWATMAGMALGIVVVALLASFRTRGWRIPAWSAGVAAMVYGLASTVYPEYPGAEGRTWGLLAIAWGLLFIGFAEWERGREAAA